MADDETPLSETPFNDEELAEFALAADPNAPLSEDAVPMSLHLARFGASLPQWYMPQAVATTGARWRVPFVAAIVGAFLLIEALGLCNTYGALVFA
jgi:hypothetical protein